MYNRYTPQPDGSYKKQKMIESEMPRQAHNESITDNSNFDVIKQMIPAGLDSADLLVIVMLLLISGDEKGQTNALLTLVIYLFL